MKFNDAKLKAVEKFESSKFIQRIHEEDPIMLKHLSILKDINKYGLITTNSQAGYKRKSTNTNTIQYEICERAFITGFMLKKDASKFIKNVNILTDKNAVYVPKTDNNVKLPSSLDIPLTITKKNLIIDITTHTSLAYPKSQMEIELKSVNLDDNNCVFIICWDTKWNRNASSKTGLFTDVLKILQNNL